LHAKYGVVTLGGLLEDLDNWRWLYLAGRLHKPVVLDWYGRDESLRLSLAADILANRKAALSAALLLNSLCHETSVASDLERTAHGEKTKLGCLQLLESVARLSYDGDVRVGIGEDPRKVQNIVMAQYGPLWQIYRPLAV
jgi:translocator assembly and maintenance protein 41